MSNYKSDLVDIECYRHHETDRAVLVSLDGDRKNAVWVPLALVEIELGRGRNITLTISEDIATEKGLV